MDQTRHMSSPSPTSTFLFQHSDRSFKTNLLTPSLLDSVEDVSDVDDCFSSTKSTSTMHQLHDHQLESAFGDTSDADHEQSILVSDEQNHEHLHDHHHHHHHLAHSQHDSSDERQRQQQQQNQHEQDHRHHQHDPADCVVLDEPSLNGVHAHGGDDEDDDVDGMHNMLSGSTTSSSAAMPLLTDGHSHNPFSRISLEEYSPLSLVDECDGTLAISPNSLACGPNHPFKTSLSNLKMDHLDGVDVGVHDDDVVVGGGGGGGVSGGVDIRSMSPSLLSAAAASSIHLWSTSSTAITQNPALLSSSSASFLLSQHAHHQHQLNSLMQQLEPQSLDEPPPLLTNSSASFEFEQNLLGHRPSSEPPPGYGFEINGCLASNNIETKSVSSQSTASTVMLEQPPTLKANKIVPSVRPNKSKANIDNVALLPVSSKSARRNRNRASSGSTLAPSSAAKQPAGLSSGQATNGKAASSSNGRLASKQQQQQQQQSKASASVSTQSIEPTPSLKDHLQLNHHQKLKELQQRLFGATAVVVAAADASETTLQARQRGIKSEPEPTDNGRYSSQAPPPPPTPLKARETKRLHVSKRQEADSSAVSSELISAAATDVGESTVANNGVVTTASRTRTRSRSRRKSRAKSDATASVTSAASAATTPSSTKKSGSSGTKNSKFVATETAEPDTTTTTSDCIKLANLLANTNSIDMKNSNINMMLNNVFASDSGVGGGVGVGGSGTSASIGLICDQNNINNDNKRLQHIQLQVSPSLTVLANGTIPISMHQPMSNSATVAVCSGALDNQVLCRPVTVMAPLATGCANSAAGVSGGFGPMGAPQIISSIMAGNELVKGAPGSSAGASDWSNGNQPTSNNNGSDGAGINNNNNNNNNNNGTNQAPLVNHPGMGTHQIAIQVICQDGTSLVLPVSSAATLNGLTLAPQNHQQLQAILGGANGTTSANQQAQQHRAALPLVSVANIVAQQQQRATPASDTSKSNGGSSSSSSSLSQNGGASSHGSGLAASSPTLAALLDAGSSSARSNNVAGNNDDATNSLEFGQANAQGFVSSSLLRKLMGANQTNGARKRASASESLGPSTTSGSGRSGGDGDKTIAGPMSPGADSAKTSAGVGGKKRAKVENSSRGANEADQQAKVAIMERQGLVVANGNDGEGWDAASRQTVLLSQAAKGASLADQLNGGHGGKSDNAASSSASLKQQLTSTTTTPTNKQLANSNASAAGTKQCKMTSSTGNRQVDPTQPFRCEHCNSTFTRLGNFTRHKKIHTVPIKDGQRFKCDVCSKSFLQRCDLARHLHIHRGTEPHRCNICGKGYIRHSDLVTHQRFHNKEKPFGCPHCSKGFCQRGDLNRHLRSIHLQMKPILCPCCNRKFAKQETLLRHLNTAHRGRPGAPTSVIAEITAANYTISPGDDKQPATISLVATRPTVFTSAGNSNTVVDQKTVASLQAIQATLCKVQQSADPSIAVKVEIPTTAGGVVS